MYILQRSDYNFIAIQSKGFFNVHEITRNC